MPLPLLYPKKKNSVQNNLPQHFIPGLIPPSPSSIEKHSSQAKRSFIKSGKDILKSGINALYLRETGKKHEHENKKNESDNVTTINDYATKTNEQGHRRSRSFSGFLIANLQEGFAESEPQRLSQSFTAGQRYKKPLQNDGRFLVPDGCMHTSRSWNNVPSAPEQKILKSLSVGQNLKQGDTCLLRPISQYRLKTKVIHTDFFQRRDSDPHVISKKCQQEHFTCGLQLKVDFSDSDGSSPTLNTEQRKSGNHLDLCAYTPPIRKRSQSLNITNKEDTLAISSLSAKDFHRSISEIIESKHSLFMPFDVAGEDVKKRKNKKCNRRNSFNGNTLIENFKIMDAWQNSTELNTTELKCVQITPNQGDATRQFIEEVQEAMRAKLPKTLKATVIDPTKKLHKTPFKDKIARSQIKNQNAKQQEPVDKPPSPPLFQRALRYTHSSCEDTSSSSEDVAVERKRKKRYIAVGSKQYTIKGGEGEEGHSKTNRSPLGYKLSQSSGCVPTKITNMNQKVVLSV